MAAANSADAGPGAGPAPSPKALLKAPSVEMVRTEIQALENSKDEQKAKVAEQLGTRAAVTEFGCAGGLGGHWQR